MKTYKYAQGSKNASANYSSSADVNLSLSAIDSNVMTMTATDSRGNSTTVTKTLDSSYYKDYSPVVIGIAVAVRGSNGVGQDVALAFSGTYWNGNFGSIANDIVSATYQYKESSLNTWSTETALTVTKSGANYSFAGAIQGNLGANGFSVEKSFDIKVSVTDRLVTKTYTATLGSGTPALAIYKDNIAIGQKYDTNLGGKLQVNGSVKILGTAQSKPLMTRGIVGSSSDCSSADDLYLQYNVNKKIMLGNGGSHYISADGSTYSGNATNVTQKITASSKTHTNYNNNQGYVPAMSFLTYWNGAYNSSNGSNLTYAHQGTIQCKPKNLYNNTTGTTGTVTLNETAGNFTYLDIFYRNLNNEGHSCVRVYSPNGKSTVLANVEIANGGPTYIKVAKVSISGTSITNNWNREQAGGTYTNGSYVYVTRVDGWK